MVPAKPPNTHPRPHLMPKEPTDLLNWSRRWTISGVKNVTLYYKIFKVIQLFWWLYKWSLAQALYKTLDPFLLSNDIRSEGSIAIVKMFDFDFFMIFDSTSLPQSKKVFEKKISLCVCVCVCVCVCKILIPL